MATFQLFFQSREQVIIRRGHIRRIGCEIKKLEAQVGQFLLGCMCPVSRNNILQEQVFFGEFPAAYFLQNVLQLHQQRYLILRIDRLGLGKIINDEYIVLIPKKPGENFSSEFFNSELFGAR